MSGLLSFFGALLLEVFLPVLPPRLGRWIFVSHVFARASAENVHNMLDKLFAIALRLHRMDRSASMISMDLLLACHLANTTCTIMNVMTTPIFIIASRLQLHAFFLVVAVRSFLHVLMVVAVNSYFQLKSVVFSKASIEAAAARACVSGSRTSFARAALPTQVRTFFSDINPHLSRIDASTARSITFKLSTECLPQRRNNINSRRVSRLDGVMRFQQN